MRRQSFSYKHHRLSLTLIFTGTVFAFMTASVLLILAILGFASIWTDLETTELSVWSLLSIVLFGSVLVGSLMTFLVSRFPLHPFNAFINHLQSLAGGDFDDRIHIPSPWGKIPALREIESSYNQAAEELSRTETLRRDFINNFSHEFKTPIASIAGFAKLVKKGDLPEEQKNEYISIIEEESLRLSALATNVFNLSKIMSSTVTPETKEFNLSEQIRTCMLILQDKWSGKSLDLAFDFGEYSIQANEELMKEVWINLFDNAIKFTPEGGMLRVSMTELPNALCIAVFNSGSRIPEEKLPFIFNMFYQGDESHSQEGNGIGLSIVKKVLDIHKGTISVDSKEEGTTFFISLPYQKKDQEK